jgi:hypothetical protein
MQSHRVARGEALECGAALDVARCLLGDGEIVEELRRGKEMLIRIVSMLTRMVR